MRSALEEAVSNAIHQSYVVAEVMRLCAAGVDQMNDKDGASAAISAFYLLAGHVEANGRELDNANVPIATN